MADVLYLNKPAGMTSFAVCQKLRRVFKTTAIGHTGTLDPNATGLLIILLNKACKANQFLSGDDKEYIAEVKYGIETDTLDITGKIVKEAAYLAPSSDKIKAVLNSFIGTYDQLPPLTSAIRVKGKHLYEYQRAKREVTIPSRSVRIDKIELLDTKADGFVFKAAVGSGTYIRSLVRDILNVLGLCGTLAALKRTRVGKVTLAAADELSEVLAGNYHLHSLYDLLKERYLTVEVPDKAAIICGKSFTYDSEATELFLVAEGEALAIYRKVGEHQYRCVRGLF